MQRRFKACGFPSQQSPSERLSVRLPHSRPLMSDQMADLLLLPRHVCVSSVHLCSVCRQVSTCMRGCIHAIHPLSLQSSRHLLCPPPQASLPSLARSSSSPSMPFLTATVTSVSPAGMGDRACVDLCSSLEPGWGLLVGVGVGMKGWGLLVGMGVGMKGWRLLAGMPCTSSRALWPPQAPLCLFRFRQSAAMSYRERSSARHRDGRASLCRLLLF